MGHTATRPPPQAGEGLNAEEVRGRAEGPAPRRAGDGSVSAVRTRSWAHPEHERPIVVAGKDGDTVPVGTLSSIRRASGLEELR
jgi:hypothetical protein